MLGSTIRQAQTGNEAGETVLHTCSDTTTAMRQVTAGFDVNARNTGGQTPLHRQMRSGHKSVVIYLLTQNHQHLDVNAQEADGTSPLHLAEDIDVVNLLLSKSNINPNITRTDGITPLMWAVIYQKDKAVIEAIANHPRTDFYAIDNEDKSALDYASHGTEYGREVYALIASRMQAQAAQAHMGTQSTPFYAMAQSVARTNNAVPDRTRNNQPQPSRCTPQ